MDFDTLVIMQTWLTSKVIHQNSIDFMTPAGYSLHHASRAHKRFGELALSFVPFLSVQLIYFFRQFKTN